MGCMDDLNVETIINHDQLCYPVFYFALLTDLLASITIYSLHVTRKE
jgi:hypothetical protein